MFPSAAALVFLSFAASISAPGQDTPRKHPRWLVEFERSRELPQRVKAVSARMSKIRKIETDQFGNINDNNYLWVYGNRENLIPVLIECLKLTKPTNFPCSMPIPPNFTIGDLSLYLLCDWGYIDWDKTIVNLVGQDNIKAFGYYAYFDWVRVPGNRYILYKTIKEELKEKLKTQ